MDRYQLKYGTDYTSVKVQQEPGGKSSINLGWQEPKVSKYGNQTDSRGSNRDDRNDYRSDPVKGRGGRDYQYSDADYTNEYSAPEPRGAKKPSGKAANLRNYDETYEDRNYGDSGRGYEPQPSNERGYDYGRGTGRKVVDRNYEEPDRGYEKKASGYERGGNEKRNDPYGKSNERCYNDSGRERNHDTYGRGYQESPVEDYGRNTEKRQPYAGRSNADLDRGSREQEYERPVDNRRRRDDDYSSNNYGGNNYASNNYSQQESDLNPRRTAKQPPKTSVKVQNPPGGQSSFIFG